MIEAFKNVYNRFLGRGDAAIVVPVMDGPLKPNERLDAAERVAEIAGIDNLVSSDGRLWASSGDTLGWIDGGAFETLKRFDSPISSIAADSQCRLAIGLEAGKVLIFDTKRNDVSLEAEVFCPTALLFWDDDQLIIASGSKDYPPEDWQADLMTKGTSGRLLVWSLADGGMRELLAGLAYPAGLMRDRDGRLVFSEAWNHRLCAVADPIGKTRGRREFQSVLTRLPGYPGAISRNADDTAWLAAFAPRNQLVEFVLTEREYCARMVHEVEKPYWVAPTLRGGRDFHEPMQWGAVMQLGVLKPWAPVLSYGLAVRLSEEFQPLESLHSRADGHVHGVVSVTEFEENGRSMVCCAAKGDGVLVKWRCGE